MLCLSLRKQITRWGQVCRGGGCKANAHFTWQIIHNFLQFHMTDNSHVLNLVMFQPLAKHHYKTKCSGTRVLTRAVTARAPQWQVDKKSVVVKKLTLRATAQARCLKKIFHHCVLFLSSTMCFQGELHPLHIWAGGKLSFSCKHGSKPAGGLCRQSKVCSIPYKSHTIPILLP